MWQASRTPRRFVFLFVWSGLLSADAFAADPEISIVLSRDFIAEYKDRAAIETCLFVDKAQNRPNAPRRGGALSFAGRSDDVELAVVGLLINAREVPDTVKFANESEGDACVEMTGAWRLWCPPGPARAYRQGAKVRPLKSSNPTHVFEIHPAVLIEQVDLSPTWHKTRGYSMSSARRAINAYDDTPCKIRAHADDTVTLTTVGTTYDYGEFIIEVLGDGPEIMIDGVALYASVHDLKGRLIERKNRLVFVEGTAAEKTARKAESGDRLRVIALPRISLKLVDWRLENADDPAQPLDWYLPYEFIVVEAKAI